MPIHSDIRLWFVNCMFFTLAFKPRRTSVWMRCWNSGKSKRLILTGMIVVPCLEVKPGFIFYLRLNWTTLKKPKQTPCSIKKMENKKTWKPFTDAVYQIRGADGFLIPFSTSSPGEESFHRGILGRLSLLNYNPQQCCFALTNCFRLCHCTVM